MCSSSNERVGCIREGMEHIITDEVDVGLEDDWLEYIGHHLRVHSTFKEEGRENLIQTFHNTIIVLHIRYSIARL